MLKTFLYVNKDDLESNGLYYNLINRVKFHISIQQIFNEKDLTNRPTSN
jgi:hypothetical protein